MKIKVSTAWWLKSYLLGVVVMWALTGRDYDEAKVTRIINRALRFRVVV